MAGISFEAIRALAAVASTGSLQQAARQLSISATALGRRIDSLEQRLGVRLLHRSTRATMLTEDGAAYLERVLPALDILEQGANELHDRRHAPQGRLRVALPVNYGQRHITPWLSEFLHQYPGVWLDASFEDRYVDVIGEGFDLAIRVGALDDSRLVARQLMQDRRAIVAAPLYLEKHGVPRHPDELKAHHCLHFTQFRGTGQWSFHNGRQQIRIAVNARLTSNYGLPLTQAAEQGLGIAQTSLGLVSDAIERGTLVTLLDDWQLPDIAVYAVYPNRRLVPARVNAFIDFVSARLQKMQQAYGRLSSAVHAPPAID